MVNLPKVKVVILIVIFVLLFISAVAGFMLFNNEYQKSQSLEKQLEEVSKAKEKIEKDLQLGKEKTKKLDQLLEGTKDKMRILSAQINDGETLNKDLRNQLDSLNSKFQAEASEKSNLEKKVSRLQGDLENFLIRFKELEQEKKDLQLKLDQHAGNIELEPIIIEPQAEEDTVITKLSGNIIKINREYEFAVVNIGQEQDVEEGDIFSVYNVGRYIGDIEIEKAHPAMSAAKFLPNLEIDVVRESDTVVKKD